MQTIAEEKTISVAQLALSWLLHQPVVSSVIIGAKRIDQLDDNLKAVDVALSPEDLQKLDDVSRLAPEYPGWMLERQGQDRKAD
jgi:aryl-alcohol dehydrogenase-like predicted oxidoreductase